MTEIKDIKADSLENTLLEPMSKLKTHPMTEEQTKIMMSLFFAEKAPGTIDAMYEDMKKAAWALAAIEKRIEACLSVEIDKSIQIFLTVLAEGNIGTMIMYCYYLQYWAKKNNKKVVKFEDISMEIFPMGFFAMEDLNVLWDEQKVRRAKDSEEKGYYNDNLIDYATSAQSIQFDKFSAKIDYSVSQN